MRSRTRAAALALVALVLAACGGSAATLSPSPIPTRSQAATAAPPTAAPATEVPGSASPTVSPSPSPSGGVPAFDHVYVIVLENRSYSEIVGKSVAPYINSLVARYGLATNFYAETHPSEPNYIALTSGGLQGTNSDGTYNLTVPSIFDQVETAGRTWHVYAQDYPGNCYKGSLVAGGIDGPGAAGEYARKHNPAISYASISRDSARCANITALAGFDPGAANLEFIIPNQINDMHSSRTNDGDAFLAAFVPKIINSPAFANSVLFITWDEGVVDGTPGGHIATVVAAPGMPPGSRFSGSANHYSILRTIELAWGMPFLGQAATASTLDFQW